MAASSSSSNAATLKQNYDVFLSFRGADTRYNFVSHLYAALDRKKVKTYKDDENLERAHEISYALLLAINESKLSIVIFSENYASSTWCLDELVHILQCKDKNQQIVVPVFYHVDPSHVRKQQGNFGKAFSEIETRFIDKTEKVNEWRDALKTAANLSGWDSSLIRDEAELVGTIVDDIITNLKRKSRPMNDFKGLVGTEERIKEIESLLHLSSHDIVRTIGIWGMGGIGKTTLATIVFNQFSFQFEACCFLENIREEWTNGKKKYLQNKLYSELLEEKDLYNVKERLHNTKVLIVLDDVNELEQLDLLVGDCSWFGHGSRIMVTTRDMHMLKYIDADAVYEVEMLNSNEALQLFVLNAFKRNIPTFEDMELSKRVVNYVQGIPLALKVLGSFLYCKKREIWEDELEILKQDPKIQNVLKKSYDGLHKKDQQIFLEIACCCKGMKRDEAEKLLDVGGYCTKTRIDDLIDKSLITIKHPNILWMHDLVQEMGWEIVRSNKEPEIRRRLSISPDLLCFLKNMTGIDAIEEELLEMSTSKPVGGVCNQFKPGRNIGFIKAWKSSPSELVNKFGKSQIDAMQALGLDK